MINTVLLAAACLLTLSSLSVSTHAAQSSEAPRLKKIDLFEGDIGGFKLYRIPGLVVTSKGTLLAYCEARKYTREDYGEIETHLRRSTDGGTTWSKATQIAHKGPRIEANPSTKPGTKDTDQTVNNPVAIADRDGTVHFLYCVNYEHCFYMRSEDDGVTFSEPINITAAFEGFRKYRDWNVIATGPSHGIQLKNGRLVVPVWIAYGGRGRHGPSFVSTIYSDDHGKTWNAGEVAAEPADDIKSPGEPIVVELADGSVMLNARNPSAAGRRLVTISKDGATGWSKPRFDDALIEPICAAGLVALPSEPTTLIFSNPDNVKRSEKGEHVSGVNAPRRNLSIRLSPDSGKSWSAKRTLEEGTSAYSDLAVLADGTIACFYERDQRLTFARFNKAWILARPPEAE